MYSNFLLSFPPFDRTILSLADNSCNSTHRQLRDPVRTHIILLFECPSSCSSTSESASNEPEPVLSVLWNLQTAQYDFSPRVFVFRNMAGAAIFSF